MPFVNDGLVIATDGGNISIDWNDPFGDPWSNKADGIISVTDGGTLQLGGPTSPMMASSKRFTALFTSAVTSLVRVLRAAKCRTY